MRERRRGCRTPGRVGSPRLQTPRPAPAPQPAGYGRPCTCTPGPWLHPIRLGLRAPFWGGRGRVQGWWGLSPRVTQADPCSVTSGAAALPLPRVP